jgi:hypothetical protein
MYSSVYNHYNQRLSYRFFGIANIWCHIFDTKGVSMKWWQSCHTSFDTWLVMISELFHWFKYTGLLFMLLKQFCHVVIEVIDIWITQMMPLSVFLKDYINQIQSELLQQYCILQTRHTYRILCKFSVLRYHKDTLESDDSQFYKKYIYILKGILWGLRAWNIKLEFLT